MAGVGRGGLNAVKKRYAVFLGGLLVLAGCRSRNLSREEAKAILDASPLFTPAQNVFRDLYVHASSIPGVPSCPWPKGPTFPRVVDAVTGLGELSPSERTVEFSWAWDLSKYSKETAACFWSGPIPGGRAIVRRYDDGWRVVEVVAKE
jgi:hypothetical protein